MTFMSTTYAVEVKHDTELLELLRTLAGAQAAAEAASDALYRTVTVYRASHTGEVSWSVGTMPHRDKLANLPEGTLYYQAKTFTRGDEGYWVTGEQYRRVATLADVLERLDPENERHAAAAAKLEAAKADTQAAVEAVVEHEKAYTGWSRYFLVTSSTGHVHSSMNCSTCNPRTTFAPVVALSGQSDTEAVELLGETLCTVCFPEAPVTGKPDKITAAKARKLVGA